MGDVEMVCSDEGIEMEERKDKEGSSSAEVVSWEKFLPKMVLRVLLVEADDSTRRIISALLRKCSYKVAAVPDGLTAWETLKGRPQNIDIILTELDLPLISGFALLTLVMEHDACKNIPIIMMSSQDSISMVLKCMLKGAADFLIKPVRRNELQNLWQHVWRRQTLHGDRVCQTLPTSQPKLEATAENNAAASNHSRDYVSSAQKISNDNGSDVQSSCSTRYMEAETAWNANFSNASSLGKHVKHVKSDKESDIPQIWVEEKFDKLRAEEGRAYDKAMQQYESVGPENVCNDSNSVGLCGFGGKMIESSIVTMDLIGIFDKRPEYLNRHDSYNDAVAPELELSLRRFSPSSSGNQVDYAKQMLNQSNASGFSWYDNSKSMQQAFAVVACDSTEPKEPRKSQEPLNKLAKDTIVTSDQQGASGSNNLENITSCVSGQSGQAELTYQSQVPMLFPKSGIPSYAWITNHAQQQEENSPLLVNTLVHSNPDLHLSEEETVDCSIDQNLHEQNSTKADSNAAGQSTCAKIQNDGIVSHDNSTNSIAAVEKGTALESLKSEYLSPHDGFRGMDYHRSSQREAALTKFRLKRKDRCFEKKVRYQSRKKLAEQRPRVKGQFVRLPQSDTPATEASHCT